MKTVMAALPLLLAGSAVASCSGHDAPGNASASGGPVEINGSADELAADGAGTATNSDIAPANRL